MKKILFSLLLIALATGSFFACRTVDIRTAEMSGEMNSEKGKRILQQMAVAHGNDKWDNINTYSLELKDEFYGLMGKMGNPFPKGKAHLAMDFIPKTFTGKGVFQEGKWKGKNWGIQSWKTYSTNEEQEAVFHAKNDKDIEFWLPTYQYFMEASSRLLEADVISYAGSRSKNGQEYDLVFVSWKSDAPQKDIDQYILWINKSTHRLDILHYTIRDFYSWIHGNLEYNAYYDLDGLLFPKEMSIRTFAPKEKSLLHKMQVENVRLDAVDKSTLLPNTRLGTGGKIE